MLDEDDHYQSILKIPNIKRYTASTCISIFDNKRGASYPSIKMANGYNLKIKAGKMSLNLSRKWKWPYENLLSIMNYKNKTY